MRRVESLGAIRWISDHDAFLCNIFIGKAVKSGRMKVGPKGVEGVEAIHETPEKLEVRAVGAWVDPEEFRSRSRSKSEKSKTSQRSKSRIELDFYTVENSQQVLGMRE